MPQVTPLFRNMVLNFIILFMMLSIEKIIIYQAKNYYNKNTGTCTDTRFRLQFIKLFSWRSGNRFLAGLLQILRQKVLSSLLKKPLKKQQINSEFEGDEPDNINNMS